MLKIELKSMKVKNKEIFNIETLFFRFIRKVKWVCDKFVSY